MSAPHLCDRLQQRIHSTGSIACVGLDPRPAFMPPTIASDCHRKHGATREAVAEAFLRFNRQILTAIADHCAAVKVQSACYEAYGAPGFAAMEASIAYAKELGIPVIIDAKRNDIGSTAEHYAQAFLGAAPGLDQTPLPGMGGDWLTVNGYLGADGITPFLSDPPGAHGIFVLVRTSNPSSADLQDQACDSATVMERMADLVRVWGEGRCGESGLNDVGAVVGATWPEQARQLRQRMPETLFLVPGYGAQGGSAADAIAGARPDGSGVLVNSSRGIIAAWQQGPWSDDDWAAAAHHALDTMNTDLQAALKARFPA